MIVAPQPDAVVTGAVVLKEGGNAVDAAIACALVQTVVDPLMVIVSLAVWAPIQKLVPTRTVKANNICLFFIFFPPFGYTISISTKN